MSSVCSSGNSRNVQKARGHWTAIVNEKGDGVHQYLVPAIAGSIAWVWLAKMQSLLKKNKYLNK